MSRRNKLADGAPACTAPAACAIAFGGVALLAAVLYVATAFYSDISNSDMTWSIVGGVLSAGVALILCAGGCSMWLQRRPDDDDDDDDQTPGDVSYWRLGCFVLVGLLALVAAIAGIVVWASSTAPAYASLIVAFFAATLVFLFIVAVLIYYCVFETRPVRA